MECPKIDKCFEKELHSVSFTEEKCSADDKFCYQEESSRHDDSSEEYSLLRVDIQPGRDTCLFGECLLEPECFNMVECSGKNEFSDKEDRSN